MEPLLVVGVVAAILTMAGIAIGSRAAGVSSIMLATEGLYGGVLAFAATMIASLATTWLSVVVALLFVAGGAAYAIVRRRRHQRSH